MELINKAAEYGIAFILILVIASAIVVALAMWMQNNPTLQARRNKQNTAHVKAIIAKENAK